MGDYEKSLCPKCDKLKDDISPFIEDDYSVTFICSDCAKIEDAKTKKTYNLKQQLSILKEEITHCKSDNYDLGRELERITGLLDYNKEENLNLEYERSQYRLEIFNLQNEILRLKKALIVRGV